MGRPRRFRPAHRRATAGGVTCGRRRDVPNKDIAQQSTLTTTLVSLLIRICSEPIGQERLNLLLVACCVPVQKKNAALYAAWAFFYAEYGTFYSFPYSRPLHDHQPLYVRDTAALVPGWRASRRWPSCGRVLWRSRPWSHSRRGSPDFGVSD